jgi:hypothetical protein
VTKLLSKKMQVTKLVMHIGIKIVYVYHQKEKINSILCTKRREQTTTKGTKLKFE